MTPPDTTPLPYDPYVPPVQLVVERAVDINVAGDGSPAGLIVYGGALVFSAVDGDHGTQLWSYNGAAPLAGRKLTEMYCRSSQEFAIFNIVYIRFVGC